MEGQYHHIGSDSISVEEPTLGDLMEWEEMGVCEATDGCLVEPDGVCPHGFPSWLIEMGIRLFT